MSWIAPITYETASPEVREILDHKEKDYLERCSKFAYQLRNHVVYDSVETNAWRMDGEVQRVVGKRYGDLLEYYISLENGAVLAGMAVVCNADNLYDNIFEVE